MGRQIQGRCIEMGGKVNPEVRASYLINHIHGLTADQLKYWIKCGWLKPMQGEGYDRFQTFTRQEYMKAKFMMYLNQYNRFLTQFR
jgi:hypothetical protein